jgi:hypothetical protein
MSELVEIAAELNGKLIQSVRVIDSPHDVSTTWHGCPTLEILLENGRCYQIWGPNSSLFMVGDENSVPLNLEGIIQKIKQELDSMGLKSFALWKHYKGEIYAIDTISILENDLTILVNYCRHASWNTATEVLWSRPLRNFLELVTLDTGETVPRFVLTKIP